MLLQSIQYFKLLTRAVLSSRTKNNIFCVFMFHQAVYEKNIYTYTRQQYFNHVVSTCNICQVSQNHYFDIQYFRHYTEKVSSCHIYNNVYKAMFFVQCTTMKHTRIITLPLHRSPLPVMCFICLNPSVGQHHGKLGLEHPVQRSSVMGREVESRYKTTIM